MVALSGHKYTSVYDVGSTVDIVISLVSPSFISSNSINFALPFS